MTSLSGLGIGLSLVFGCLLLALVAELYYLLWWKKRITNREIEDENYTNQPKVLFSCFKKPNPLQTINNNNINSGENVRNPDANSGEPDLELGSSKDLLLKANYGEDSVESELMRLHNLAGPPRFLFTIKEEEKEDMESEDAKSRRGSRTRSLSDLILAVDNPFLTAPLPSPPLKSSPLNPLESYKHHGFNPLFESSTEAEMNRLRSSPPPKFKFLRDAEEKLLKRLMEEAEKRASRNSGPAQNQDFGVKAPSFSTLGTEERDGSFIRLIVGKNKESQRELHCGSLPQFPSSSSQVLPLASSPLGPCELNLH
ncbi:uncharacterized protein LOC126786847 [Argentina anserina]|uniref:uncharacterized protein LOC126786847 n=1 Tax=Argentina anserina TaxID=57926 RepID=UPI0021761FA6|nr:uncharacterized protein LOC126786847 [Potentilla anserina]XP_050368760.1 uncharacterized protein LOC126786847 [Potentilla anserina]XP_050368761.1 uncharacterized protein LOC126786847 [Potentilla anserina]